MLKTQTPSEPIRASQSVLPANPPTDRLEFDWFRPREAERLIQLARSKRGRVRLLRAAYLAIFGGAALGVVGGGLSLVALVVSGFQRRELPMEVGVGLFVLIVAAVLLVLLLLFVGLPVSRWADRLEAQIKGHLADAERLKAEHAALLTSGPRAEAAPSSDLSFVQISGKTRDHAELPPQFNELLAENVNLHIQRQGNGRYEITISRPGEGASERQVVSFTTSDPTGQLIGRTEGRKG